MYNIKRTRLSRMTNTSGEIGYVYTAYSVPVDASAKSSEQKWKISKEELLSAIEAFRCRRAD